MFNSIKNTTARISELEAQKQKDIDQTRAEIEAVTREWKESKALSLETTDQIEYSAAVKNLTMCEGRLNALNRKIKSINSVMAEDEYKHIRQQIIKEFRSFEASEAEKINKELLKLLSMMNEYNKEASELSKLLERAKALAGKTVSYPNELDIRQINPEEDPDSWFNYFSNFYFQTLSRVELLRKANNRPPYLI